MSGTHHRLGGLAVKLGFGMRFAFEIHHEAIRAGHDQQSEEGRDDYAPITVIAIGMRLSAPGPRASAGGTAAASVASEVIKIGRSLTGPAKRIASRTEKPSMNRFALVNSTSRIEFFFTMPMSRTRPIRL